MPYQNPELSPAERAADLLTRLTVDEKIAQLNMANPAIPRLGIPAYHWWNEALHGVARNGRATMFPQAIAIAASFSPEAAFQMGEIIRKEAWIKFQHHSRLDARGTYAGLTMYSPNINIFRDPRWGRGHETYGECPVLTSLMGNACIRGIQGDDPEKLHCAATVKHYAVHSGPEATRDKFDSIVSDLDLAQTYLYAFAYCLKHDPVKCVMTAYNKINGIPVSVNEKFIGRSLQDKYGFTGVTVTDVGTASFMVSGHKFCKDMPEALALQVASGVDVCCELTPKCEEFLKEAYDRGLLDIADIDRAVRNQFTLKFQLGIMDENELPDYSLLECKAHRDIAENIARKTPVLLKNDGILPLDTKKIRKIAVIGPTAADIDVLRGNYAGTATRYTTILDGLINKFGEDNIIYAKGSEIFRPKSDPCAQPGDRYAEAVIAANHSDTVILCLGLTPRVEGENGDASNGEAAGDKQSLEYFEVQKKLLDLITETGKPVVLLNISGSALIIPEEKVNAVLQVFYPGADGGKVVADILDGSVNPSGRLPVTFYKDTAKLPDFENYSMAGRTYRYCEDNILYPFGFGLSYTTFEYTDFSAPEISQKNEDIPCSVTVRNTGKRAGETAVLFFFREKVHRNNTPLRQFSGAKRIFLHPGEKSTVDFVYPAEFMQFADEKGCFSELTGEIILETGNQQITITRR